MREDQRLPQLGWIARVELSLSHVTVLHGSSVERGDSWLVEGVWDRDFGESFAASEHFFGSGLRVANGSVWFVPSCALVDRLLWAEVDGAMIASNSLALLLAATGWRLVPGKQCVRPLYAITRGVSSYDDGVPTTGGTIHQLYYHNMEVGPAGRSLHHKAEPCDIASFEDYDALMTEATCRLGENLSSRNRAHPVVPLATISRGYDSPAVCALGRAAGLRASYTSRRSNSLIPSFLSRAATDDDGTVLAQALGLTTDALHPWLEDELHFLAGSIEPELVFGQLAAHIEGSGQLAAVFTGYHGDMVWRVDAFSDHRAPELIRHDVSGLNLSEIRLKAGFFNVPLTFLYARSQASIGHISRSEAMHPWRTWTDYDRPIPRRILTDAGVDGALFGMRKKAVVQRPGLPETAHLRAEFLEVLRRETGYGRTAITASRLLDHTMALPLSAAKRMGFKPPVLVRPADLRPRLYAWAVNRLALNYSDHLQVVGD